MAGPWYIDGDNGNDGNTGLSEAQAFATIQFGVGSITSGDTIYVQNNGSTVYAEMVTITDLNVKMIGYGSTVTDGVKAVIDGADTRANCILFTNTAGSVSLILQNFELKQATAAGFSLLRAASGSNSEHRFDNIWSHDNGAEGFLFDWPHSRAVPVSRCRADLNVTHGFSRTSTGSFKYFLCTAFDNAGSGFETADHKDHCSFCIAARNAINFDGIATLVSCIADASDGSDNWVVLGGSQSFAYSCGFSNAAAFGIDGTINQLTLIDCGFYNNTSGDIDGTPLLEINSITGNNPGYADAANEDYTPSHATWAQLSRLIGDPDQAATTSYTDIGPQLVAAGGGGGEGPLVRSRLVG